MTTEWFNGSHLYVLHNGEEQLAPRWSQADLDHLGDPEKLQLFNSQLKSTGHNLRVYLFIAPPPKNHIPLDDSIKGVDKLKAQLTADRECDPLLTQLVLTHNTHTTKNWYPVTPWMALHHIHHIMLYDVGYQTKLAEIASLSREAAPAYLVDKMQNSNVRYWFTRYMGHLFMTTRAARTQGFNGEHDVDADMFAQYMMTKRIKLMKNPLVVKERDLEFRKIHQRFGVDSFLKFWDDSTDKNLEWFCNTIIPEYEQLLNERVENLRQALTGKRITF